MRSKLKASPDLIEKRKHFRARLLSAHETKAMQRAGDRGHEPAPPFRVTDFDRFRTLVMMADEDVDCL